MAREKSIREYMKDDPRQGACSRCGRSVPVGPGAVACVCSTCTALLAARATSAYKYHGAESGRGPDESAP